MRTEIVPRQRFGVVAIVVIVFAAFALGTAPPALASAPSVTINQASGQADPATTSPIVFTVTFSQPVSGFDGSDVSVEGSTAGGPLIAQVPGGGGPSTFTVEVSGMTTAGIVEASIPANAAINAASEASLPSTSTDHKVAWSPPVPSRPSVTINQASGQVDPATTTPIVFTVTFSEPVSGFDGSDVSLEGSTAGGPLIAQVPGGGGPSKFTVEVSGMTTAGIVEASIPADAAISAASKESLASTSADNTVDWLHPTTPPTVTLEQASGQADPASVAPVQFTATFSRPVSGFDGSDILLSSSTAGGVLVATVTGGPTVFAVGVSGMTSAGDVIASIRPGAAVDASGNASAASTSTDDTIAWRPATSVQAAGSSVVVLSKCTQAHPCVTGKSGSSLGLKVRCESIASCTGTLAISLKGKLGKLRFKVAAGATKVLRIPLDVKARRLLAAKPKVRARLAIVVGSTMSSQRISFRLPG